jgi:hypothetical protein
MRSVFRIKMFSERAKVDAEKEKFLQEQLKLLTHKVQERRLNEVWDKFLKAGLHPILIKGWATGLFYPNPADRLYVDFDLVFDPNEFAEAQDFVKKTQMDFLIDLHRGARHLDSLSFSELYQNSVLKNCGNGKIRVPSDEDHLRIICVHWLNDGGADKDKLWDIYYAVENRRADFDWDKCLNVVSPKRRFWIVSAIGLAHHYLNLRMEGIPFSPEFKKIPKWVYRTVEKEWASGVRLLPLHHVLHNKKGLWVQIRKRIPPNPIQATIEVNGAIDQTPRIFYQMADIFKRLFPSWKRISQTLENEK